MVIVCCERMDLLFPCFPFYRLISGLVFKDITGLLVVPWSIWFSSNNVDRCSSKIMCVLPIAFTTTRLKCRAFCCFIPFVQLPRPQKCAHTYNEHNMRGRFFVLLGICSSRIFGWFFRNQSTLQHVSLVTPTTKEA